MGKEKYSLDNYPVAEDKYNLDNYQLVDTVGEAKVYQKKNGTSNGTNGLPVPTSPSAPLSGSEENINTPPQVVPEMQEPPTAEQIMQAKGKEILSRQTDLTNLINEYNRRFGTDISQDILNDPDKTANFLTQFTRTIPEVRKSRNDRLKYLTENPDALNIQIINGKGVNVGTAAEKNQMLAELGDRNNLFNKEQQYKKQLEDKTIDLGIAKGKLNGYSHNRIVNETFKRLDPEGYRKYHETIAARTGEQGDTNDEKLWKGASDQVDILNTVKAPFEKIVNDRLQNTANDMMVVGTLTKNDELVQNAKAYQLEVKSDDDLDREYPVLAKHRLAAAISDEIRKGTGVLGTLGVENLTLLGNAFSSRSHILQTDAWKAALADPLQRDNAIDIMLYPDQVSSSTVFGSAINNFYKPFKDIVHSVGDMTTIRDRMDRQTDIIKDQLFPEENPNVSDFIHGARVVANTSSMLGGYVALGAVGGAAGEAAGLGARGVRLAHSALSFGIGNYDHTMSDADNFMGKDETAKKVIYSTIGMIINTYGGELLSLPVLSKMPLLQKPLLEMTNRIADGTMTKDLMAELLDKAKPHFMDYAEKYSINLGKNVLAMKYFGIANALNKMAFGGASGDDVLKEATTGLVETALGVSLLSGFGVVGDVKKGRANTLKSTIYRLASQSTETKDVITTAYKEGRYSEAEYNQKMQILNTAIVAKQNLDLWQKDKNVTLSIPQKAVFVSNKVAEEVIKKKLENPNISEQDKKDLTYQLETLAAQRADIQNGLNFDSNLTPLTKIYEAENAFLKAKQAFSDGEGTEAALVEAKQNFVKAQAEQSRVQVDIAALTTAEKEIAIPRPLELPQAVGKDITYNGEVGVLKQNEIGEYVFDDGSGKREVIIPVADKTNPTETLAQLGITVLPDVSPADVKVAQSGREQVGFVKSKNGNDFFISLANPAVENTVGDQVFIKGKGGKLKEVSGMTDEVKLSLVNKFLQEKGLPPRSELIKIEPLKTNEQKTTITNESINNQVSKAAESGSEIPADKGKTTPVPEAAKTTLTKVSEPSQPSTVESAVIEINGKTYEGKNHAEAILKAKADGQDISKVDRQADGKFKLSDGSIIDRAEAKNRFGQDQSELLIPQDEAAKLADKEYQKLQPPTVKSEEVSEGFIKAGEEAKSNNDGKILGKWIKDNAKVGDTISLKNGDGYEVTGIDKNGNIELTPFEINEKGEKEYNAAGVRIISDSQLKHGDLFESSYTNGKGERVVEQYKYNRESKPQPTVKSEEVKADIEKRRQEELSVVSDELSDNRTDKQNSIFDRLMIEHKVEGGLGTEVRQNLRDKINAKYDAELASLPKSENKPIQNEPVAKPLTKDAEQLLAGLTETSKPAFVTKNLERIAKENDIEVTDKSTPDDIINALKEKQNAIQKQSPTEGVLRNEGVQREGGLPKVVTPDKSKKSPPKSKVQQKSKVNEKATTTKPAAEKSKEAKEPAKTGETKKAADEKFNKKVDEYAASFKAKFIRPVDPNIKKSGAPFSDSDVINFAVNIIKRAHSVGGDIAIAIDKAVQYIKDKWNDKWGTFDEKMARRHFRNIAIEEKFAAELENNYEHYKQRYLDEYGRVLNADNAKEFSEDYRANRNYLANAVHIPSREFVKKLYAELVKAPPPPGRSNLVTINSGGTGAGKSSSTSLENEAKLNYDGTMANMNGDRLIQQALEAGNKVLVNYTFSEPLKALQNAIGRAKETSRIVELAPHINSHIGSFETIKKLHEKYKDNPNVKILFTDNRGAKGTAKAMTFGELEKIQYLSKEQINKQLNDYIDQQYKEGNLTQSEYEGFKGNEFASYRGTVPEGNNRIAEQAGRTGSAAHNAGTAEPTGRKDNTGLHGDRANEGAGTTETNGSVKSKATQQFFSDVISGEEKFKPTAPWQPEISIDDIPQKVKDTYDGFNDNFDAHIAASIPVFKETEYKKVNAIANTLKEGSVLDIGGSEGSFVKTVTTLSGGKIHTVNLDIQPKMKVAFEKRPVDNSQYIQQSFSAPYKESDGEYPQYKPADKFDVVHEAYTIQFFQDKNRHFYVKEIKDNLLKPDGVVFLQQKVMTSGYLENEAKKDKEFKSKYWEQKQIDEKAEKVLPGMQSGQSSEVELVSALSDNFKNVYQFYDAGNFKGYLASDSKVAAEKYLAAIGDTNSKFTTRDQLLKIEDGKAVQGDISSLTKSNKDAIPTGKTTFNQKVDNIATAIKNALTPEHLRDPNIHKSSFIDLDALIDWAADKIKKAHEVGNDIKATIEEVVAHLKDKWRKDEWGDFDEQAVHDHFSGIVDETAGSNAITHAATAEARKNLGQKPYEKVVIGDKQINAEADAALAKGYDVEKLLTRLEQDRLTGEGGGVSALETVIMKKYKAVLDEEVIKNPSDENLAKSYRLFQASDVAGSDQGRGLRLRQDIEGVDVGKQNLADFYNREMDVNKVSPLSEKERADVEKRYNDLKDAHDKLVQKVADQKAMDTVKRLKKTAPKVKRTHDDYVKERNDIREQIKAEKERHAKQMENIQTKGVSFSLTPKMVRLIGKLVKSHVEEGTGKLADVVDNVFDNVKDLFDGITKQDVTDIIGGAYSTPRPRSEVTKQIADLRTQVQLTKKLQSLYDGADTPAKRQRLPRSQEVQDLQKKITDYIKSQKQQPTQEQLDASKLKALKTKYTNEITKLKERLRTGKLPPERSEPVRLDREGKDLKDRYIRLKQEEELRLAKIEYAQRTKTEKLRNNVFELLNAPRTIEASLDFSAVLRQAVIPTVSHPILASKAAVEMFRQSVSQKRFDRWLFDLKESPAYETMEKSGLYIADPHNLKLSAKEEAFMNNMVEKIPILGTWLVKGSERAYISYLNKMRADLFRQGAEVLIGKGYSFENAPEQYEALASWVNNATGRGGIGEGLNKNSPILNAAFFSPRLIASRLNLLGFSDLVTGGNGFYGKLTPEVRKMAWKDMAKFIGFGTSVLLMAWLNRDKRNKGGLSVEVDPRSSDFGKIRYGDTRWDIWGGFQQYVRLASQMIAGFVGLPAIKNAETGRLTKLNTGKYNSPTYASLGLTFLRGKASPLPSLAWDFAAGENVVGEKIVYNWGLSHRDKEITLTDIALNKFSPLIIGDIVDAYKSGGMKTALLAGIPALFGVGVQTYNNRKSTAVSVNIKTPFGTIK